MSGGGEREIVTEIERKRHRQTDRQEREGGKQTGEEKDMKRVRERTKDKL